MDGDAITMRKALATEAGDAPAWPDGVTRRHFGADSAAAARALLNRAYAQGGGAVADVTQWWPNLRAAPEYDPALCFALEDRTGALVAFAQCWTSGFVKDIAVAAAWRRRGLGRVLMAHVFAEFRRRGHADVRLKVQRDNPSCAPAFYRSLGMTAETH